MIVSPDGFTLVDSPSLAERTTIRLGGEAIAEVRVVNMHCLEQLPAFMSRIGGQVRLMGEGSNVLAGDGKLPILLLSLAPVDLPTVVAEEGEHVLLRAHAGTRLPALLSHAASLGLSGLEGLCGIPGSVGGALAMNAGSFGVEMASLVHSVELFSPSLGTVRKAAEDFAFRYRTCVLREHPEWFLACFVTLKLAKGDKNQIRGRMRSVYKRKQESQPISAWSAGCVFKNPAPDAPAGRLIDEAGLKGASVGGMSFSPVHANFMINNGDGRFAEAMELIELAREKVRGRFGHELELEVQLWL